MPFVAAERARLTANLASWADGGGLEPCRSRNHSTALPTVDLMLYAAFARGDGSEWLEPPESLLGQGAAGCFRRVIVRYANLSAPEQYYIGGWDNTGPNHLFYRLFFDANVHAHCARHRQSNRSPGARAPAASPPVAHPSTACCTKPAARRLLHEGCCTKPARPPRPPLPSSPPTSCCTRAPTAQLIRTARACCMCAPPADDILMWMEADVVPVRPRWLDRVLDEAKSPRGFWRKGPAQQPRLQHSMIATHHYHMNSAGLYRFGAPCFVELMRRVATEHARQPHDVATHLFLHEPRHFHIWQAHAHRFLYTDLVQNRLDEWSLDAVRAISPETVLVHGKHRKEAT